MIMFIERKKQMKATLLATAAALLPFGAMAQDRVEATAGADLVSGYIWRGQDLGNVSIQPSAAVRVRWFSLTACGSVGIDKNDTKELDLTLGYATGGFSLSITDYWFNGGAGYFRYGAGTTAHVFEVQAGYDFGPLAVNWYTNFAGNDGVNDKGKRAYSSYVSLTAPFRLGGLDWTASLGATPWETSFYNQGAGGFEVTDIAIGVSKEIPLTERFSLPLSARAVWNPATGGAYLVAGISL